MYIDIFNGDADGILSLVQLRKAYPIPVADQTLITGVKRDISLCKYVTDSKNVIITVLDICFDKNATDIYRLLVNAKQVNYFDHHNATSIVKKPKLNITVDFSVDVCTALLVSQSIGGKYHLWAIAAAYGDNLYQRADYEADKLGLSIEQKQQLKELGMLINYNGYGATIADLHYNPADLYRQLINYKTPFDVINDSNSCFKVLKHSYEKDRQHLVNLQLDKIGEVYVAILPDQAWARRMSGTLGNELANKYQSNAIIIATQKDNGNYLISLRAPKNNPVGAVDICSSFSTGGGRATAAGINDLAISDLNLLIHMAILRYS